MKAYPAYHLYPNFPLSFLFFPLSTFLSINIFTRAWLGKIKGHEFQIHWFLLYFSCSGKRFGGENGFALQSKIHHLMTCKDEFFQAIESWLIDIFALNICMKKVTPVWHITCFMKCSFNCSLSLKKIKTSLHGVFIKY